MVGEISDVGTALLGKCPVKDVSIGEMSIQGIARSRKPLSRRCQLGISPWEFISRKQSSRETVPQPFCPIYEFFSANSQIMDS